MHRTRVDDDYREALALIFCQSQDSLHKRGSSVGQDHISVLYFTHGQILNDLAGQDNPIADEMVYTFA